MFKKAGAYKHYLKLPNLFLPVGTRLHPPLRRDQVRKLLADDTSQIVWYENVGKPGKGTDWKKHIIGGNFDKAFEAVAADLNGDGQIDVAATAWGGNGRVVWFENLGDPRGQWKMHELKQHWPMANQIIIADFNGDKRPDLAAGAEHGANDQPRRTTSGFGAAMRSRVNSVPLPDRSRTPSGVTSSSAASSAGSGPSSMRPTPAWLGGWAAGPVRPSWWRKPAARSHCFPVGSNPPSLEARAAASAAVRPSAGIRPLSASDGSARSAATTLLETFVVVR